jgi:hypothetical protein
MRKMRGLPSALLGASLMLGGAVPAAASCAPPASVADNAARAVAVVYGTVTATGGGSLTMRVDRVLKGDIRTPVQVFVGPARGGAFAPTVTSVDYSATVGSDQVLYLIRGTDGELETNACIGSHPGRPDARESAFFGPGTVPVEQPDAAALTWAFVALCIVAVVIAIAVRRRVLARRRAAGPG